ncbi:MAG: toxic anion resistance protein [Parasporobacterium sp.]|nr:toxic anion resistance protein [Parasporobacterium sp.]
MSDSIKLELGEPSAVPAEAIPSVPAEPAAAPAPLPEVKYLEDVNLTPEEQKKVDEFSEKINIHDTDVILRYGSAAQKKIAEFSDAALEGVKTKDLGEIGKDVASLVTELKGFDVDGEESKGFLGFFRKKANDITSLKARYDLTESNVNKITDVLRNHQNQLLTDIVMLDKMYDSNLVYFKELTMYILAGKKKLEHEQSVTLAELKNKALETGLAEDAQKANDFAALCDRFDKKLHDLELTRTVSMQMAPQIRLIQNSDTLMTEKIQSTINNTIPLWKNQMVLAMGMAHSEEAMKAQKLVTDFTDELIRENSEKLKQSTVAIAEESERGIVGLEAVKYANEQLITSLTEVIRIQEEGRSKRRDAENELGQIEAALKQKLLDIRNTVPGETAVPETAEYVDAETVG